MLALKGVAKSYGQRKVLSGASLQINPKDCLCILGDAASGKSTILRLLIRAEDPTGGAVEVDGVSLSVVPPPILQLYRRRLGIIFQEPILLAHATVAENIALPLDLLGAPSDLIKRNTDDLLKRLGLSAKANLLPEELSGSERALVGFARAIITSPIIVIADEPFANLDTAQIKVVTALLLAMHKKGTTLIVLSREQETARTLHARTVSLEDGRFLQEKSRHAAHTASNTHRILEETEHRVHEIVSADPPAKKSPAVRERSGKKIRITSINSGN